MLPFSTDPDPNNWVVGSFSWKQLGSGAFGLRERMRMSRKHGEMIQFRAAFVKKELPTDITIGMVGQM